MSAFKIRVILQSRVGSTRRPEKALARIGSLTLTERAMRQVERAFNAPQILAIPDSIENDPLEEIGRAQGWDVFRGSESDVLSRFAGAVRRFSVDPFIRATGDNPFLSVECMQAVAEAAQRYRVVQAQGWPYGTGVEAARGEDILTADMESTDPYEREHVFPFFYARPDRFPVHYVPCPYSFPNTLRLTVDTPGDLERARRIVSLAGDDPSLPEIIAHYNDF